MRNLHICFAASVALLGTLAAYAQVRLPGNAPPSFKEHSFKASNGQTLRYSLFTPSDPPRGERLPLVVCLHGAGGGTHAATVLAEAEQQKKRPCFLFAPACDAKGNRWVKTEFRGGKGRAVEPELMEALDAVIKKHAVDPARIYITGQSMGGVGTWGLIAAHPERFAAAVPVCGLWDPADAKKMIDVPIWAFHGAKDNAVPVSGSRDMIEALRKLGARPKYTEYPNLAHGVWGEAYATEALWEWVFAQRRPASSEELARLLKDLDTGVIVRGKVRVPPLASMLARDAEARLRQANRADAEAWSNVKTRADWERFRDARLLALRASLGPWPDVPTNLRIRVTGSHAGDGYRVENLVFQSRPGLVVTANLYRPARTVAAMPGILIAHSHARPKHNGTCQDMAMTWARAGCLVIVPDLLGHGERRQHPFGDEAPFDYHGRYDMGVQLHLAGESLMGWIAWDMMRTVDVLLGQEGVDPKRILLVSEPAGGGDVGAVTAALDARITGVLVNNFGGPEPESAYPLARDADRSFDYATSGSWESTRNLRLSARDGFLPWTIVASVAPRRLLHYHEFYWDKDQDPVWKRLQRVYGFYDAGASLAGMGGRGFVVGDAPANTHWLALSREITYPTLERWFAIPNPKKEYSKRRPLDDLRCLTADAVNDYKPAPLHLLLSQRADERLANARAVLAKLPAAERRDRLRQDWSRLLGDVAPAADPVVLGIPEEEQTLGHVSVERIHLRTEPGIVVPVLLLTPAVKQAKAPVVICLAQEGKQVFLERRAVPIAELLAQGVAVCLVDVRGTGETSQGDNRGRGSPATSVSSSEWMLGQSLLGARLRDLRSVMRYLRQHARLDVGRLALWGDSFAEVNPAERDLKVPHNAAQRPPQSEPLGGLLALLGGLFEDDVKTIYVRGGLSDFRSVLEMPLMYVPHDVVVPGILTTGDLDDLAATLAPRPLWLDSLVDGMNRLVPKESLANRYRSTGAAYQATRAAESLRIGTHTGESVARWLTKNL